MTVAYVAFDGQLDEEEKPGFVPFDGELDAPEPRARRGGTNTEMRGNAYTAPVEHEIARRVLPKPLPDGGTVLDQAAPASLRRDPMLDPAFVQKQRELYANIPESDRLPILQEAAKRADVQGRAAKVILADVLAENQRGREQEQINPEWTSALARAPAGKPQGGPPGPSPARRVDFPDAQPTLAEVQYGALPAESLANRKAGLTLSGSEAQTEDMAARAQILARDFEAEATAKTSPHLAALASGGGQMVAGLLNSMPVLLDYASRMFGITDTRAPNAPGVDDILKTSKSLMPKVAQQGMGAAWDKGEFAPWLVGNLAAQAPQVMASMASAFVPGLRPLLLPMMGRADCRRCVR
jgi:hypothetical protein